MSRIYDFDWVERTIRSANRWQVRRNRPPPELAAWITQRSGRPVRKPSDQLVVRDEVSDSRIYIKDAVAEEPPWPFLIRYGLAPDRVSLLREVLKVFCAHEGIHVRWGGGPVEVEGMELLEKWKADPHWYWGYDPVRRPGSPFREEEGSHID